ncbi:MAG TPA: hypothetical protein VGG27_02305 [Magnetospirillaceae bacterium]|jgi:hypothetical protein
MMKWLMRRQIAAFDKAWNYDSSYALEIMEADPKALLAFGKVMGVSRYRQGVPAAPYYAAKIVAVMAEDCGPCTQLVVDMAQKDGVNAATLRAIIAKDIEAMPDDVALAAGFAEATLRHASEADAMRDAIVDCWGKRGLVSLAFAITTARIFPTVKYALGHGHACMRLTVGGETKPVLRHVEEAA